MSEMEHCRGTLKLVEKLRGESLEEQCQRLLNNKERPSYYDSYQEMLRDEFYKEYIICNDAVYSIDSQEIDPYEDIFIAYKDENGAINFEVQFYNGGCSLNEAIETALENLKE